MGQPRPLFHLFRSDYLLCRKIKPEQCDLIRLFLKCKIFLKSCPHIWHLYVTFLGKTAVAFLGPHFEIIGHFQYQHLVTLKLRMLWPI